MGEKIMKMKIVVWYLFIGATALTFRFLFLGRQSFGLDEAFSYWVARHSLTKIVDILHYDAHPPLFYMFLHFWEKGGNSATYLRIPFALCGAINIILLYFLGEEFLGKRMGYFIGGIWAVSFYALKYESWCRMYAPAVTFSLAATWFFWKAFKQPSLKSWGKYFIFAVLSIYTHYYTAFILLAHWIFLLFQKRWREASWGLICITVAYLPWFPVFFFQIGHKVSQTFPGASFTTSLVLLADPFWAKPFFTHSVWYLILGILDLLAWFFGLTMFAKNERKESMLFVLLFGIPFLIPLMITLFTPIHIFAPRYAIVFLPYFVFPIVKGLSKLSSGVWVSFLACFLVINLFVTSLYFTSPVYQKQNFRLAAEKLRNALHPGTFMLVKQIGSLFPLAYYLPQDLKIKWREGMYLDPVDPGKSDLRWYGISGTQSIPFIKKVGDDSRRICLVMCQYQINDPGRKIYAYLAHHDRQTLSYRIRDLSPEGDIYIFFFKKRGLK